MCPTSYGVCLSTGTGSTFTPQTKIAHWALFGRAEKLKSLLLYLENQLDNPNTTLLWFLNSPAKCMGSERIAKRVKETMTQLGIPKEAFKAHSLRGATATHLKMNGMEPQWVQSRGGWQSPETMQVLQQNPPATRLGSSTPGGKSRQAQHS